VDEAREATGTAPAFTPFSRRALMQRAGLVGVAAFLAQLPMLLDAKGLLSKAGAQTLDLTQDALSGLLAFILPGDDEYSKAQGVSADGPGAIGAGTLGPFMNALDNYVPASALGFTVTIPASHGVGLLLDDYALQVNAAATNGPFLTPFARLTFGEKAEVFSRFEADELVNAAVPELKFVASILPGFVAFMACSEAGVLDSATGTLSARPVAWTLSRYGGPSEGHAEFKGYYGGRRSARPTPRSRGGSG
jgi:hypothetical protein